MQPLQLQGLAGLLAQQYGGYGQQEEPRFDFEPPDPESYRTHALRQANAAAPSGVQQKPRGLAGFMERMFSSGSTEGVSEEDRRSSLTNAMLVAGQAIVNSDNPVTGLGQALLAGKQVYGQGIAKHLQAAAEDRQKQQMRDALRSVHVDPAMADYDPEGAHQLLVAHMAPQAQPKPREPIISKNTLGQDVLLDPGTMRAQAFGGDNPVETPKPVAPEKPIFDRDALGRMARVDPVTNQLITLGGNNPARPREPRAGDNDADKWTSHLQKSGSDIYWVDPPTGPGQMPTFKKLIGRDLTGVRSTVANSIYNRMATDPSNFGADQAALHARAWKSAGDELGIVPEEDVPPPDATLHPTEHFRASYDPPPDAVSGAKEMLSQGLIETTVRAQLVQQGFSPAQAVRIIQAAQGGRAPLRFGDSARTIEDLTALLKGGSMFDPVDNPGQIHRTPGSAANIRASTQAAAATLQGSPGMQAFIRRARDYRGPASADVMVSNDPEADGLARIEQLVGPLNDSAEIDARWLMGEGGGLDPDEVARRLAAGRDDPTRTPARKIADGGYHGYGLGDIEAATGVDFTTPQGQYLRKQIEAAMKDGVGLDQIIGQLGYRPPAAGATQPVNVPSSRVFREDYLDNLGGDDVLVHAPDPIRYGAGAAPGPSRPTRQSAPLGQGGPAAGMQVGGVQVPQKTVSMPGARGSFARAGVVQSRAPVDPEEAQDAAELVAEKGEEEARKWLSAQGHKPSEVVRIIAMARGMMLSQGGQQ